MAITYDAGTNIITVTQFTEATPCTFTDIYNEDTTNSWGVVTKQCDDQFCFAANLQVGDGSTVTWLSTQNEAIQFGIYGAPNAMWSKANSNVIIGKKETDGSATNGSTITQYATRADHLYGTGRDKFYGNVKIYNSKINIFKHENSTAMGDYAAWFFYESIDFEDVLFYCRGLGISSPCTGAFKRCDICQDILEYPFWIYATDVTFEDVKIYRSTYGIRVAVDYGAALENTMFEDNTYDIQAWQDWTGTLNLIDCTFDATKINHYGPNTGYIYEKYNFDLKVIDKDNTPINAATVKIWDKDGTLIVDTTTDVNGVITTQTITRGYYRYATGNTLQEYSPHLIKIEKAGYTTYEADFTLEEKTDWTIALQGVLKRNPAMTGGMV